MVEPAKRRRAGDVTLCVRDRGSGPVVVLLHGTTANLGVWDGVVDHLRDRVRTVAVDQRGHGRSDKPAAGYGAAEYCGDVAALVRGLDCGPVVIAGHSLGARNAVVLGAREPGLVAGVVAVDYTPFVEGSVLDELERRVRAGNRTFGSPEEIEEYMQDRYPLMPIDAVRRRVRYGYVEEGDACRPLADPDAMVSTVDGLRRDFVDETRQIAVPVTLMRGEHSGIVSPEAFAATRRLRPDLRAVELSGLDHYVPEEDPAAVAAAIAELVEDVA